MKKSIVILLFILISVFLYSQDILEYTGCGVVRKVIDMSIKKEFLKTHPGLQITIEGTGDLVGIRETSADLADIGGTCRHKLDIPEEKYAKMIPFAWDAIVVIVNKNNPINNISSEQLKKVLTGEITNWKELNGKNIKINLYIRNSKNSGVGRITRELLFNDPNVQYSSTAKKFSSTTPLEAALENDNYAIAVSGVYSSRRRKNLKILSLDNIKPTNENIRKGKYPLFRPLYLVYNPDLASKIAIDFINFVLSEKGQSLLRNDGIIPLKDAANLWKKFEKKMKKAGVQKYLLK